MKLLRDIWNNSKTSKIYFCILYNKWLQLFVLIINYHPLIRWQYFENDHWNKLLYSIFGSTKYVFIKHVFSSTFPVAFLTGDLIITDWHKKSSIPLIFSLLRIPNLKSNEISFLELRFQTVLNNNVNSLANIYLFKVNKNTRKKCEICSELTIKTRTTADVFLVSLLLTLNVFHIFL